MRSIGDGDIIEPTTTIILDYIIPDSRALMQSGIIRSNAQSPPPITLPARTLAILLPCLSYWSGLKKLLRHEAMAIYAAPLLLE